jgi:multicomponent Na+:H+ antiporter subunit D
MNLYYALPLHVVLTSLIASLVMLCLPERMQWWRTTVNMLAAVLKLLLVIVMLVGVARGHEFGFIYEMLPGISFYLHADALTMLLSILSALLWLITTIYAIGYLEGTPNRRRFFGYFGLCVASTMGIAAAGNLFTFFIFYELLTVSTWPLVVHTGTRDALRAGRVYLAYTLGGGSLFLLGIIGIHVISDGSQFTPGGFVTAEMADPYVLRILFLLLFFGTAVKTAMVPFHGWLPQAMVAPAPVSALLHAVAVVKAGAFGVVRLVYDVFGVELTLSLGMNLVIAVMASITIVYGSIRALLVDDLKARLAWSTVSQVSYIALGVGIAGPLATVGGLVHLVHQGLMKITLFFCVGAITHTTGVKRVSQMDGMGKRMPLTMIAFSIGALGMIGLPPMAGFISKMYLGVGAVEVGAWWVVGVLVASTVLNAAYFLPILGRAWFAAPATGYVRQEARPALLYPAMLTAAFTLGAGVFAGLPYSPLQWVIFIAERFYQ